MLYQNVMLKFRCTNTDRAMATSFLLIVQVSSVAIFVIVLVE